MGIRGLHKFVNKQQDLLTDHELRDTFLIVDGNNFHHTIHNDLGKTYSVYFEYGGDYDKYRDLIVSIFGAFKECGVTPIVVFDGGNPSNDQKKEKSLKRAGEVNDAIVNDLICYCKPKRPDISLLALEVFQETLRRMEIPFCASDFKADNELAVLAKCFNAPVLSDDSDFYIYDNPAGFIPLKSLIPGKTCPSVRWKPNNENEKYLKCKIFHRCNFKRLWPGLQLEVLPILSALMGNEFVKDEDFEKVRQAIWAISYTGNYKNYKIMTVIVKWLEGKSVEQVVEFIKEVLDEERRNEVDNWIEQTISTYLTEKSCSIAHLKERYPDLSDEINEASVSTAQCEVSLPGWFMQLFREAYYPPFVMNCFTVHRHLLYTQMEVIKRRSTFICSRSIRKHVYGILSQIGSCNETMQEYYRSSEQFRRHERTCDPKYKLNFSGQDYRCEGRVQNDKKLYFEMLGVSEEYLDELPSAWAIFFAVFIYWRENSDSTVGNHKLHAVILSVIYVGLIVPVANGRSRELFPSESLTVDNNKYVKACEYVDQNDAKVAERNIRDRTKNESKKYTYESRDELEMIHDYGQLQTCLYFALYLSRLILAEKRSESHFTLLNGSFITRMYCHLVKSGDHEISELLGPTIYRVFELILSTIEQEGPQTDKRHLSPSHEVHTKRRKTD